MSEEQKNEAPVTTVKKSNNKIVSGVLFVVIGLAIYLWASAHSPHMGLGEMFTKLDSYYIKEPIYSIIIIIAALLGIIGIVNIVKGASATSKK